MESTASTSALNTPINPEARKNSVTAEGAANFLENILSESDSPLDKSVLKGEDLKSEVLRLKDEQSLSVKAISRQANVDYILLNKYLKTNQNAQRSAAMYNLELKIREWLDNGDYTCSPGKGGRDWVPSMTGSPGELKVRTRITFTSKENDLVRELAIKFPSKGAITSLIPALTDKWNKERQCNGLPLLNKDQVYRKFANFLAQIKTQPDVKFSITNNYQAVQSSPRKVIRFTEEEKLHIDSLLQTFASLHELLQQVPHVTKHWNIARSGVGLDLLTEEQVKGKLERTRQSHKFTATMAHLHQLAGGENSSHSPAKPVLWMSNTSAENQKKIESSVPSSKQAGTSLVHSTSSASFSTSLALSSNCERNISSSASLPLFRSSLVNSPTQVALWVPGGLSESQESREEEGDLDHRTVMTPTQEESFASDKDVIDLSPGTFSESSYENMFESRDEGARHDDDEYENEKKSLEFADPLSRTTVVHAVNVTDMEYENTDSNCQELDTSNNGLVRGHKDTEELVSAEAMDDETRKEEDKMGLFSSRSDIGTARVCEEDSGRGSFMSCEDVETNLRSSHSEEEATGSVSQPSKKIRDVVHYQDPESLQKMACSFMNAASSKLVRQRDQYKELWLKCRKRLAQEEMMRKKAVNDLKRQKLEYEEKLLIEKNKSEALSSGAGSRQQDENQQLQKEIQHLTDELKREKHKIEGLPDMVKSFLCAHLAVENTQVVLPFIKTEKM